ncbi:MAG: hypothetical protein GXO21_00675 [Aquificae bacterium]|nr:hypothetical protein [Aquificota bacterium]
MVRIYRYDKNDKTLLFSLSSQEDIYLANTIFSEIFSDVYVDWIYILEELHEKKNILNKKISLSILQRDNQNSFVIIAVLKEKTVAVVSS